MSITATLNGVRCKYHDNTKYKAVFDEKYFQHRLFESLYDVFRREPSYEYAGGKKTEVDLAIVGRLAVETKWLKRSGRAGVSPLNERDVGRILLDVCKLANLHRTEQIDCWLIIGGAKHAFCDLWGLATPSKPRCRRWHSSQFYSGKANMFLPFDEGYINFENQFCNLQVMFKELGKALERFAALPKQIQCIPKGVREEFTRAESEDDLCFCAWQICAADEQTFRPVTRRVVR